MIESNGCENCVKVRFLCFYLPLSSPIFMSYSVQKFTNALLVFNVKEAKRKVVIIFNHQILNRVACIILQLGSL